MDENDIKTNWYYFRSLTKQLHDTEQFVDHSLDKNGILVNGSTCSYEFAKILMLSASEFEVIAKALCEEKKIKILWNANIVTITKEIIGAYPEIGNTNITTPYQTFQPLVEWNIKQVKNQKGNLIDKVDGIQWWYDHNGVKHNRKQSFLSATLKNCIDSLASVMVLELYLSQQAIGNVEMITMIGCDYFECNYGASYIVEHLQNELPDFI